MNNNMEVDDENDSAVHYRNININNNRNVNNSGINSLDSFVSPSTLSTQSLSRRLAPNSIGLQMTPTKMLLSQTRRSSSGIFITSMFGSRFRHLQKLHSDAFLGLNAVCLPGLPVGAVFRSSLPATPVATPIHREAFQQFSEQAIRERLCRTPSPRKNRGFLALALQQQQSEDQSSHRSNYQMETGQSCGHDNSPSDVQPMDITSPVIDEPVIEDVKEEDNTNGAGFGEHYFGHNERLQRTPSIPFNDRRLFVANIGYRVNEIQLIKFFRKFGKVSNCMIVKDHINKLSKGYGFITFRNSRDSQSVLNADPNQLILDDRVIRVSYAKPKCCKKMIREVQELNQERDQQIKLRDEVIQNDYLSLIALKTSTNVYKFDDLNDDVILHIFKYLDNIADKTILELVCKRWKNLVTRYWMSETKISFTNSFCMFGYPVLKTSTLFSILKKCPNLKSIDLKHVTKFLDTKALEIIAFSCPLLEEIIFDCGPVTDYGLKILSQKCQNLKCLSFNECWNFSENGFWWLLKNAKKLTKLQIRNNFKVNGNCFRLLTETIQSIDITSCKKIRVKGFKELIRGNRNALQRLSASSVNSEIMQMICYKFKNLRVLRIPFIELHNEPNETVLGFSLISQLKNLEVLECLAKFGDINNDSILLIISNCNKLKELILSLSSSVTDISIIKIPEYCPNLERLRISDSKISDKSLIGLSNMKHLKDLDIKGCSHISDIGVEVLVLNCKTLYSLDLNRCEQISYDCLKFAVETVNSSVLFPELVILYNGIRIHTKNVSVNDIEQILMEREEYLQEMYFAENYEFEDHNYNNNDCQLNDRQTLAPLTV